MKLRALCLVLALCGACGSDEPATAAATTAAGSGGTAAATAGTSAAIGGSAGTTTATTAGTGAAGTGAAGTGAAGTGAAGMAAMEAPLACGTATCTPPPPNPSLPALPVCCANEAQAVCGFKVMGTCTPPPPPAPKCPMIAFSTSRPCCIEATNTCGVDATMYGMGCLDISASMGGLKTLCDGTTANPPLGGGGTGGAAAGTSG